MADEGHLGVEVPQRYLRSMRQLCRFANLPIPTNHCEFPASDSVNAHLEPVSTCHMADRPRRDLGWYLTNEHAAENIFLHREDSVAWRHHLASVPPTARHLSSVKRRLSLALFEAMRSHRCIYCWLPEVSCVCTFLLSERKRWLKAVASSTTCSIGGENNNSEANSAPNNQVRRSSLPVDVTMLLHSEELMRTTNTGHLLAMLLDAEVRVWGVQEDDAWLASCATANLVASKDPSATVYVLLYPEEGSQAMEEFCVDRCTVPPPPPQTQQNTEGRYSQPTGDSELNVIIDEGKLGDRCPHLHIILSDGTWNQAHRVNRHVPREIPRVHLVVDPSYASLFAALRKQTRATGVSTLEATLMAVCQCLETAGLTRLASLTQSVVVHSMKRYVDVVCVHKRQEPVFDTGSAELTEQWREQRRQQHLRILDDERREGRRVSTPERCSPETWKRILPPPVVSYCYACDMFVGWSRMPRHCTGAAHRERWAKRGESWEPSEDSRSVRACNFHIQRGNPLPLAA